MNKLFILLLMSIPVFGAPKSVLIPFWNQSVETDTKTISHVEFSEFLRRNIGIKNGIAYVSYDAVTTEDKALLNNYIKKLTSTPITNYSKKEQLPYWINLYNAQTISLILENYPIGSIRQIPNRFIQTGPWDIKNITVVGQKISLNNIEHGIIRPIWKDYRIHFLVNCASIGCPNILSEALTAKNYEELANSATRNYVNHARGVRKDGSRVVLSSLFDWYGEDFGSNFKEIIQTLKKYSNSETSAILEQATVARYEYDWNLNEQKNIK
ncbi:MAG: DUF547 domain-containing protein [Brevinema sp.]